MSTTYAAEPRQPIKTTLPAWAYRTGADPGPLAVFLGVFSIALGAAEALAPRFMADLTGVRKPALLRAYGFREGLNGAALLKSDRPALWLWGRVGGDVIDLATLAACYADASPDDRRKIVISAAAVLGVTALDVLAAVQHTRAEHKQ